MTTHGVVSEEDEMLPVFGGALVDLPTLGDDDGFYVANIDETDDLEAWTLDGDREQWVQSTIRILNEIMPSREAVIAFLVEGKSTAELLRDAAEKWCDETWVPLAAEEAASKRAADRAVARAERAEFLAATALAKAALDAQRRVYMQPTPPPEDNPSLTAWREDNAYLLADPCAYCGAPAAALDHIVPRFMGGANTNDNVTAACRHCNGSKGKKPLLYWLATRAKPRLV
jgi:hypothetical protein